MFEVTKPTIKIKDSPNFWTGRRTQTVRAFVIHITDGTLGSVLSWFMNPKSQVSAHFVVAKDGLVYQMVDDENTAWHAGLVHKPTWKGLLRGINPNLYTVGIEVVGDGEDRYTKEQYSSVIWLLRNLSAKYAVPLNRNTVVNHREINGRKTCPGIHNDAAFVVELERLSR